MSIATAGTPTQCDRVSRIEENEGLPGELDGGPLRWRFLGGLIAMLLAASIGYSAAILSYRFGFDPDNHTIPLVTNGMDLLGVIFLVTALVVVGDG